MRTSRALRPFYEAAIALFSAGAPPSIVAEKFHLTVSPTNVYRWYHKWAELKGIDARSQMARIPNLKRRHETPTMIKECNKEFVVASRDTESKLAKRLGY